MIDKLKKIGIGAAFLGLLILIIFLKIDSCNAHRDHDHLLSNVKLKEQEFKTQRAKDSSEIVTQTQLVLSEKESKQLGLIQLSKELDKLKKVTAQIKTTTQFIYDRLDVPFDSSNNTPTIVKIDSSDYLKLPQYFNKEDKWFSTTAFVDTKGLHFDSLRFRNEAILTIGLEYKGLFSKPNPVIVIQNMNPYATTTQFSNIIIQNRKKWYQTNGFWGSASGFLGFVAGLILGTQIK